MLNIKQVKAEKLPVHLKDLLSHNADTSSSKKPSKRLKIKKSKETKNRDEDSVSMTKG